MAYDEKNAVLSWASIHHIDNGHFFFVTRLKMKRYSWKKQQNDKRERQKRKRNKSREAIISRIYHCIKLCVMRCGVFLSFVLCGSGIFGFRFECTVGDFSFSAIHIFNKCYVFIVFVELFRTSWISAQSTFSTSQSAFP